MIELYFIVEETENDICVGIFKNLDNNLQIIRDTEWSFKPLKNKSLTQYLVKCYIDTTEITEIKSGQLRDFLIKRYFRKENIEIIGRYTINNYDYFRYTSTGSNILVKNELIRNKYDINYKLHHYEIDGNIDDIMLSTPYVSLHNAT